MPVCPYFFEIVGTTDKLWLRLVAFYLRCPLLLEELEVTSMPS